MEIGPQRASPPSASGLPSLCPEMRKCVAQGDFGLHSHQQCSNASVSAQAPAWRLLRGSVQWCIQKLDEEFGSVVSLLVGIISI